MPTIGQRMLKLKEKLLSIRLGPGAAILPKDVTKIHMRLARKIDDGHRGPKKFVSNMLPRLKYRNPAIPMLVDRSAAQSDPAVLTVFYKNPPKNSTAAESLAPASTSEAEGHKVTIQMKHKSESEILQQLYETVGVTEEVQPTEIEKEELAELKEQKERSRRDSERMAEVNRQRKREAQMLAAARGELANPA